MNRLTNFPRLLIIFLAMLTISLGACKKTGKVTEDPNNRYHNDGTLSANVAGNNWQAKSVYAVDSSNLIFIVAGSSANSSSFPVILLAFPDNTAEGSTIQFNIALLSFLQFYEDAADAYWAEPAFGGSGTLTISKFNKSTKRVEGSFTANLKNRTAGAAAKSLSNGQFAINYR